MTVILENEKSYRYVAVVKVSEVPVMFLFNEIEIY